MTDYYKKFTSRNQNSYSVADLPKSIPESPFAVARVFSIFNRSYKFIKPKA